MQKIGQKINGMALKIQKKFPAAHLLNNLHVWFSNSPHFNVIKATKVGLEVTWMALKIKNISPAAHCLTDLHLWFVIWPHFNAENRPRNYLNGLENYKTFSCIALSYQSPCLICNFSSFQGKTSSYTCPEWPWKQTKICLWRIQLPSSIFYL